MQRQKQKLTPPAAAAAATDESDLPHSSPLLPDLPDDVALQCIARVPRFYHSNLSLVSKSWRSMFSSPFFFSTRDRLNCTQHLLYFSVWIRGDSVKWFALDYNPSNPRKLSPIPPIPRMPLAAAASAVLGYRIYVLGGSTIDIPSSNVWVLDCRFNRWEIGPKMSIERIFAGAGVLNGKIYVVGGCSKDHANWAEVFDPELGYWVAIPSPVKVRMERVYETAVMDEKFYFRNFGSWVVFDPCDSSWRHKSAASCRPIIPTRLYAPCWSRNVTVINGILYFCDEEGEIQGFAVKKGIEKTLKGVQKDWPNRKVIAETVNFGGRLCVLWVENRADKQKGISYAEVEVRKDSDGELWGSIVWSQQILLLSSKSSIVHHWVVEL